MNLYLYGSAMVLIGIFIGRAWERFFPLSTCGDIVANVTEDGTYITLESKIPIEELLTKKNVAYEVKKRHIHIGEEVDVDEDN